MTDQMMVPHPDWVREMQGDDQGDSHLRVPHEQSIGCETPPKCQLFDEKIDYSYLPLLSQPPATPSGKGRRVYISGPMSGIEDCNYPAFNAKQAELEAEGWDVENPARHFGGDQTKTRAEYLTYDMGVIPKCSAVYMLDGWRNSPGARLEYNLASELGLEILGDSEEPVELEASRIVRNGERQAAYGHPNQDFQRTAAMWSGILGVEVSVEDVALCMIALKLSRLKSSPGHHDSMVDVIGYGICMSRLDEPYG